MADNVVGIDITARLDAFRAELAKIPDIGGKEAKTLTAALSKEIKAAERAAKDAAKASRDTAKGMADMGARAKAAAEEVNHAALQLEGFGDSAGKAGSNAGKLAGFLDMVAPGAGGAAQALADLGDVGEVAATAASALGLSLSTLAAVALPIAAIVVGVGLAWQDYSATAQEAAEYQERLNDALDEVGGISSKAKGEIEKLRLNLGQLTQAQYDDLQIRHTFEDSLESGTAKLREEKTAIEEKMAAIGTATHEYLAYQDRLHEVNGLLETAITLNEQGQTAALQNAEFTREQAEADRVLAERLKAKAEAERRAAERTQKAAEAAREHAKAVADEQARVSEYNAALSGIEGLLARNSAEQGKLAQIEAQREAQLKQLTTLEQAALDANLGNTAALEEADAQSAEARRSIWSSYYADLTAYHDELQRKLIDDADKTAQKEAEVAAKVAASAVSSATSTLSALDSIASTIQSNAEAQGAEQEKLAMAAFAVHQGAAVASAGVTTAKMALDAYAAALELGAPGLVLAPIAAGAAVATGIAQVAAIASEPPPKFHAGMAPDEYPATLKRGEGVLSGQGMRAAGGAQGVRDLNRGHSQAPAAIVVRLDHQLFEAAGRRSRRLGGILADRAARLGHRERR